MHASGLRLPGLTHISWNTLLNVPSAGTRQTAAMEPEGWIEMPSDLSAAEQVASGCQISR